MLLDVHAGQSPCRGKRIPLHLPQLTRHHLVSSTLIDWHSALAGKLVIVGVTVQTGSVILCRGLVDAYNLCMKRAVVHCKKQEKNLL